MRKLFLGLILFSTVLLMTGCYHYTEETWLRENGSGKMKMEIALNEALMNMASESNNEEPFSENKVKNTFKGKKDIKLLSTKSFNKDGNRVIQMELEFKSLKALEALNNSEDNSSFIGKMTMAKNKKGQVIFTRVLSMNSGGSTNGTDSEFADQMMASIFANYNWKYSIHFPYKVISANTADSHINRKTNTVQWEIPLSSIAKKPQQMTAVLRPYNFFEYILYKLNLYR